MIGFMVSIENEWSGFRAAPLIGIRRGEERRRKGHEREVFILLPGNPYGLSL